MVKIYAFADEASNLIDEQILAMKRNGLNGLEIRNVDGQNVSVISPEKAREVKAKLDANELVTWSIGSPIGKIGLEDDFSAHIEKFKHTLEIANILEAKNIRLFSFFIKADCNYSDYKNEVIDRLGKFIEVAKGTGISLCHENEKGIYGNIASRCLELHKALPELKGIFDPANFVQCGQDTLKAWEMLKEHIYYMHIKDALTDGYVVPAGYGAGNLKQIVKEFIAFGGKDFTIEPHLIVFDGLNELEQDGNTSEIGKFKYPDKNTAFDAACSAFKVLV